MNIEDALKVLGLTLVEWPRELPSAETEWVRETALHILNSRLEGENYLTTLKRLEGPLLQQGREKFPECKWLHLFLLRETFKMSNHSPQ